MSLNTFGDKLERKHEREKRIDEMRRAARGDTATSATNTTALESLTDIASSNSEHSSNDRSGRRESVQRGAIESVRHFLEEGSSSDEEDEYFYPMIASSQQAGHSIRTPSTRSAPKSSFLSDVVGFVMQPPSRNAETEIHPQRSTLRAPPREVIDFFWDREPPEPGNVNLAPRFDPESGKSREKHDKTYLEEVGLNNSSHHRRLGSSSHHRRLGSSLHSRRAVAVIPEKDEEPDNKWRRIIMITAAIIILGLGSFAIFSVFKWRNATAASNSGDSGSQPETKRYKEIRQVILDSSLTNEGDLDRADSAQNQALKWIADVDPNAVHTDSDALLQRYALATFYYSAYLQVDESHNFPDASTGNIEETRWSNSDNWMSGAGICMWEGVTCPSLVHSGQETTRYNENADIIGLNLSGSDIFGTLPSELEALENLKNLDLSSNRLQGSFPPFLGNYRKLETLKLSSNGLKSTIPANIFERLTDLRVLDLSSNTALGFIPEGIKTCSKLQTLKLNNNIFVGSVPSLAGLESLEILDLSYNNMAGSVPSFLGDLEALKSISLHHNRFNGNVTQSICALIQTGDLEVLTTDCNEQNLDCNCCTSCYP